MTGDRELDVRIAKEVEGAISVYKNVYEVWYAEFPGKPPVLLPYYGMDTDLSMRMLARFTEQHGAWFSVGTVPPPMRKRDTPDIYMCSIQGGDLAYRSAWCTLTVYAPAAARAIRSAVLQMLDIQKNVQDE